MKNSPTPSNNPHIFIQSNSPGELSAWAAPIARTLKQQNPHCFITLYLVPCQYATGQEEAVARSIPNIDDVIPVKESLKTLLSFKKVPTQSKKGAVLYCGGDPFYIKRMAKKTTFPAYAYTEHAKHFPKKGFKKVFTKQADGDLMAANITNRTITNKAIYDKYSLNPNTQHCLIFPGSRPEHFKAFFSIMINTINRCIPETPDTVYLICVSPFISDDILNQQTPKDCHENIRILRAESLDLLQISDLMISLPGTNTAEALYMHCPMLTLCPLNQPELLILDGLAGFLVKLPLIGNWLQSLIVAQLVKRTPYSALPNKMAQKEISPEFIGIVTPEETAPKIITLLNNPQKRAQIKQTLITHSKTEAVHERICEELLKKQT